MVLVPRSDGMTCQITRSPAQATAGGGFMVWARIPRHQGEDRHQHPALAQQIEPIGQAA